MRDNRDQLVGVSVQGTIASPEYPALPASPYVVGADGTPRLLPAPGGIVYNVRTGDTVFGWQADMVQPGVSIRHPEAEPNQALNILASLGNQAVVVTGAARGAIGTVVGKSGRFAEHVIVDFEPDVLEKLALDDRILIRAVGRGLALRDFPEVQLKSLSPVLLDSLGLDEDGAGFAVPVTAELPAALIGAGSGLVNESGCVQIQTEDRSALAEHGLQNLRLGDIVAIRDYDTRWGPGYLRGAITIGAVVHGDSPRAGYGPGVTPLLTAASTPVAPVVTEGCNLVEMLGLRSF